MSLGGIAIAIGAMVDAAIIMVENAHKRLEQWEEAGRPGDRAAGTHRGGQRSGQAAVLFAAHHHGLVSAGFTLEGQEGRLFKPLAFTKTFAMFFAALLSITLAPVLMVLLIRGRIHPEAKNPVNRFLIALYTPRRPVRCCGLRRPRIALAILALIVTVPVFMRFGSEFMPPLNEGMIYYMPTTLPEFP